MVIKGESVKRGAAGGERLHPDVIDRVLRKYARTIGVTRVYSAHLMRATFITTALDNGASLEDVQSAAGHADPSTTKLYDRRGYNPEKSASFLRIIEGDTLVKRDQTKMILNAKKSHFSAEKWHRIDSTQGPFVMV